jgi:tRNA(Arg) A34 adenosine deaminase TadA
LKHTGRKRPTKTADLSAHAEILALARFSQFS